MTVMVAVAKWMAQTKLSVPILLLYRLWKKNSKLASTDCDKYTLWDSFENNGYYMGQKCKDFLPFSELHCLHHHVLNLQYCLKERENLYIIPSSDLTLPV